MEILLIPPIAFFVYLILVTVLTGFGRMLAGPSRASALKSSTYASGEAAPVHGAMPGYRSFFVIALFFAMLHLGVLMLGSSSFTPVAGAYLVGLMLALLALMLG